MHSAPTSERNIWYQFSQTTFGQDIVAGKVLVDLMVARNDPRLDDYFGLNANGEYGGYDAPTGTFNFVPADADFFLLAALVAYSGAGGVTNIMLSNWARDKGYGMSGHAGYIPAAVGGKQVELAHTGFARCSSIRSRIVSGAPPSDSGSCGTSGGVPRVGNHWGACDPTNPKNRRTRCSLLVQRKGAEGEVAAAQAALAQAAWRLEQKSVAAPVAGLVQDTFYVEGEWVGAGRPVASLLPPGNVKVRFYVPQTLLGSLQVGRVTEIRCDGCPAPIAAKVSFISSQAEYTPPVLYSKESRSKLVFLVEARPQGAARLHPGQPVDVQDSRRVTVGSA